MVQSVLILYAPVNNFAVISGRVRTKCLAQGHNAVPPVRLEEPICIWIHMIYIDRADQNEMAELIRVCNLDTSITHALIITILNPDIYPVFPLACKYMIIGIKQVIWIQFGRSIVHENI